MPGTARPGWPHPHLCSLVHAVLLRANDKEEKWSSPLTVTHNDGPSKMAASWPPESTQLILYSEESALVMDEKIMGTTERGGGGAAWEDTILKLIYSLRTG